MADTLPNKVLQPNVWLNLYTATGLPVGTKLAIQNIGTTQVHLHSGIDEPTASDGFLVMSPAEFFTNTEGDAGAWARSVDKDTAGYINVSKG